jgi:hypothetical protein
MLVVLHGDHVLLVFHPQFVLVFDDFLDELESVVGLALQRSALGFHAA